ncbi:MAG: aldose 1-epimerase family protein [Planctomycetota bacterium]
MAESTWSLVDRTDRTYIDQLEVTPESVGGRADGYYIHKHRLHDGLSDGVDVVHVDNGTLRFDILPTRGMNLWKAWLGDQQIGWNSPVNGPVHPAFVPLTEPSGLGWLEGFDELLARCGLESNGAPEFDGQGGLTRGLHGRITNKPAHEVKLYVNGETGEIAVTGVVDEVRMLFSKLRLSTTIKTKVGQNSIEIHDTVENLSASPTDIQMLYHINLGVPLLEPGASVVVPVKTLMPRNERAAEDIDRWSAFDSPLAGYVEQVYFCDLQSDPQNRAEVLLKNAQSTRAVSVHFNTQQLPCFSLWKNQTAEADGYVTGLEPATNYPNPRGFEQSHGRVMPLAPRASCSFDLRLEAHANAADVTEAEQRIKALCEQEPVIHDRPQPRWCSEA